MSEVSESSTATGGRNQRRLINFLIQPGLQFRYVFWALFTGVWMIAGYSMLMYLYMHDSFRDLLSANAVNYDIQELVFVELKDMIIRMGGLSVVFLTLVCGFGILLSHGVAGPLFRFKKIFREIRDGNLDARIVLRPKDELQDVAAIFNEMMDKIQGKAPATPQAEEEPTKRTTPESAPPV